MPLPMTPDPRTVLMFDYDGVLVDSLEYFVDAFIDACRSHGHEQVTDREAFLGLFDTNLYDGMEAAGIPRTAIDPILKTMGESLAGRDGGYVFYPGIPETLHALSAHAEIYVISSNLTAIVANYLARHGISCVRAVLGGDFDTSKVRKIRSVMAQHPGCRCYYVGDTRGDMIEARKAGALSVAAAWGWHGRDRLQMANPDRLLHAPSELLSLIR